MAQRKGDTVNDESEIPGMMCDRSLDDDPVGILDDDDLKMSLFHQRVILMIQKVLSMLLFRLFLCSYTALLIYVSLQM